MQEPASGVEGTLIGLRARRVEDWAAVIPDGFKEHSLDSALSRMGILVPLADHLSAQGMQIVAVESQSFARARELQLVDQEDLEQIRHDFPASEIGGFDTPCMGPAIDIKIIFLEGRGMRIVGGLSGFSSSGHKDAGSRL